MELRVLDINIWHGLYARSLWKVERLETVDEKEERTRALIEKVHELDPDVVLMQECFPQPGSAQRIAEAIGHDCIHVVSNAGLRVLGAGFPFGAETGEGSSILAKKGLGLAPVGSRALSGFGWTSASASFQPVPRRMALAASVTVGNKRVVLATAHVRYDFVSRGAFLESWSALVRDGVVEGEPPPGLVRSVLANMDTRDRELDVLADWLTRLEYLGDVTVIGADLNLDDDAPQIQRFQSGELMLTSALGAVGDLRHTWDPEKNPNIAKSSRYAHEDGSPKDLTSLLSAHHDRLPQRPDHVLLGRTARAGSIREARVVLDEPVRGVVPSDHFGIFARIELDGVSPLTPEERHAQAPLPPSEDVLRRGIEELNR